MQIDLIRKNGEWLFFIDGEGTCLQIVNIAEITSVTQVGDETQVRLKRHSKNPLIMKGIDLTDKIRAELNS